MARVIHSERQDEPSAGIGCSRWQVRGVFCDNTAAKFWSGLIDEVQTDYPFPTAISLCAATCGRLSPFDLHPDRILERDIADLAGKDLRQAYQNILSVLEITGPPPPTIVHLTRPDQARPFLTVMLEQPDAETMPFLLAWLLEWQEVPPDHWNDPVVEGEFVAEDTFRCWRYEVRCHLANRHLSEGLFLRETTLQAARGRMSPTDTIVG